MGPANSCLYQCLLFTVAGRNCKFVMRDKQGTSERFPHPDIALRNEICRSLLKIVELEHGLALLSSVPPNDTASLCASWPFLRGSLTCNLRRSILGRASIPPKAGWVVAHGDKGFHKCRDTSSL